MCRWIKNELIKFNLDSVNLKSVYRNSSYCSFLKPLGWRWRLSLNHRNKTKALHPQYNCFLLNLISISATQIFIDTTCPPTFAVTFWIADPLPSKVQAPTKLTIFGWRPTWMSVSSSLISAIRCCLSLLSVKEYVVWKLTLWYCGQILGSLLL